MPQKQKIGIIGNGNVGSALEKGLKGAGHEARAVGNEPDQVRDVAKWADTVVLAVPWAERENAFQEMGGGVQGKVVVDVTNALGSDQEYAGSLDRSGAEEIQQKHRGVKIVKAFNTVFASNMAKGAAQGEPLSLLVAGDDEKARQAVMGIGQELGFDAVDAGALQNARWLETLGYLNITLGYQMDNGTESGFRYVHPGVRKTAEGPAVTAQR